MLSLMPFILACFSYGFWFFRTNCIARTRGKSDWFGKGTSSLVILLFLIHPSLVQYMFNNFNCYDVDGEKRVLVDLEVVCY